DFAGAPVVHDARAVAQEDVLPRNAEPDVVLRRGDCRGAGAGEHDLQFRDVFADHLERVEQCSAGDDGGAMLVVMKDGNPQRLPERFFYIEAVWSADVLEVDAADRRLEQLAELDDVIRILRPDLEVEHIQISKLLEEIPLALHDGLARECTN